MGHNYVGVKRQHAITYDSASLNEVIGCDGRNLRMHGSRQGTYSLVVKDAAIRGHSLHGEA